MYGKLLSRNVATVVIYLTLTPQSGTQYHHRLHAVFNNMGEIHQFPIGSLNVEKNNVSMQIFVAYLQGYRHNKEMLFGDYAKMRIPH